MTARGRGFVTDVMSEIRDILHLVPVHCKIKDYLILTLNLAEHFEYCLFDLNRITIRPCGGFFPILCKR